MSKYDGVPVLPPEGFVRLPVIVAILGIGKTSWWRGIKNGRFPKAIKLGPRTSVWRVEDIRALLAGLAGGSSSQDASCRETAM